jgi:hypothetical protein
MVSGAVVALALAAPAREARADFDLQLSAAAGVSWLRTMPSLKSGEIASTYARDVPTGEAPVGGALTALGGSVDLALVFPRHLVLPAVGLGMYGAVGSYDAVLTSVDGSIAHVRPWTTYELDLLLGGVGYRVTQRRFMFSGALRPGISWLHARASVAGGTDDKAITLSKASMMLQAELEACRRLDPITRVCLQVAPHVYNFGMFNGATFGLRVEWGP